MKTRILIGAEVGVAEGINAESILHTLNIKRLVLVDPYEPYVENGATINGKKHEELAHQRLAKYADRIVWVKQPEAFTGSYDFIYIDANHEYAAVKSDLNRYSGFVGSSGVLCGHDFSGGAPGVIKAVEEFSEEHRLRLRTKATDWWFDV